MVETEPVSPDDEVQYEEFVPVLTLQGEAMVSFVKSLLDSVKIRFFVKNERVQDFFGVGRFGTGFSVVTGAPVVFVEPSKAEEAKELLAAMEDELEEEGDV